MTPLSYNSNYEIVQGAGYVAILSEMIHDARVIPTDGRPHLPSSIRQWNGDGRGHWEGDRLVVETTNFTDKTFAYGVGCGPHGSAPTRTSARSARSRRTTTTCRSWATG